MKKADIGLVGLAVMGENLVMNMESKGFIFVNDTATTENMTADKVADFIDRLSLRIHKNTFVVLDNASIHRCKLMRELRPIWEKRGLFLFFLPPYSPHLNIAETLWRILKGKWLRPMDYISTDSLLYATNRVLAALGSELNINFAHVA